MPSPPKLTSLNIFAIRENVTDVFKENYSSHPILLDGAQIGTLHVNGAIPVHQNG